MPRIYRKEKRQWRRAEDPFELFDCEELQGNQCTRCFLQSLSLSSCILMSICGKDSTGESGKMSDHRLYGWTRVSGGWVEELLFSCKNLPSWLNLMYSSFEMFFRTRDISLFPKCSVPHLLPPLTQNQKDQNQGWDLLHHAQEVLLDDVLAGLWQEGIQKALFDHQKQLFLPRVHQKIQEIAALQAIQWSKMPEWVEWWKITPNGDLVLLEFPGFSWRKRGWVCFPSFLQTWRFSGFWWSSWFAFPEGVSDLSRLVSSPKTSPRRDIGASRTLLLKNSIPCFHSRMGRGLYSAGLFSWSFCCFLVQISKWNSFFPRRKTSPLCSPEHNPETGQSTPS